MKKNTLVQYLVFENLLPTSVLDEKIKQLPLSQRSKLNRLKRQQDVQTSLAGKLLLLKGLRLLGVPASLSQLAQTEYGKPYFKNTSIGFNITHSGNFVACVVSNETKEIGIDAEEMSPIDVKEFRSCWTDAEWTLINEGGQSLFYQFWTRKEALIKAEGRGLSIPLQEVEVHGQLGKYQHRSYFFECISIGQNVMMHLASVTKINELQIQRVEPTTLFCEYNLCI